jgi:hypothetical protein
MGAVQPVLEAVFDAIEDDEGPVLSVYIGSTNPGESLDELTARLCIDADVPHKKIRRCTVQDLLNAGFKIEHSVTEGEPDCHFHVVFPASPSGVDVEKFIDCFDSPIPNPTGGKRRT